jgi:hypothetical protein
MIGSLNNKHSVNAYQFIIAITIITYGFVGDLLQASW